MFLRIFARYGLIIPALSFLSGSSLPHGCAHPSVIHAVRLTNHQADQNRSAAEKAFAEAEQLLREQRAESSRQAIERFKDSLPLWRASGLHAQEALTLKRIGDVYQPLGEYQNALTFYNQALSVNRLNGNRKGEGETLNEISYVLLNLGKSQRALKLSNQALRLSQANHNQGGIARAYNNLGEIHYGLGDYKNSLTYFKQALQLWRDIGDQAGQALALLNSGYVHSDLGEVKESFNSYHQALSLWEAALDKRGEAITLTAIGRLYSRIGETQEAFDFFKRAQRLIQPIGDPIWQASGLNGIAYLYESLGESQRALDFYSRALQLCRNAENRSGEATTLGEIGRVYFSQGDKAKALEHHESALGIFEAVGDRRMEMVELKELGKIYDEQGDQQKALAYFRRARSAYHSENNLGGEASTLNLIGRIYASRGQRQAAIGYYAEALPLSRAAKDPLGEAATLNNIARVERDTGNLSTARERAEQALSITESFREKMDSPDLRTSYFASIRQQHEFYIDLLMQMHRQNLTAGFDKAAFEASEHARARSFLETLAAARVGVREQADPSLLERERQLNDEFREKANRRMKLLQEAGPAAVEASAAAKEIDELVWQLRELEAQIRASTIRDLTLLETQPLRLADVQQRVLDNGSVLIEYVLGEERSYVWAVTQTEISSYELPPRAEIEAAVRKFRTLLNVNQPLPNETFEQHQARIRAADQELPEAAASLSDLLIGPVQNKLGTKRLLIVPDGALYYIPFQALTVAPTASRAERREDRTPLLVNHEIVYEPSASALAVMLKDNTRPVGQHSVAVFANPVFEADDPRIAAAPTTEPATASRQQTNVRDVFRDLGVSDGRVPALPASGDEADAIISLAPWGTAFKAVGFAANRPAVMNAELSQYRIIHFATHGVLDSDHPELSGLVMSLIDEKAQPQDGVVRLHDIYNLKLAANLVVLSACNTGLGKDMKGEGLIGLTRGFMYAGAKGVVASLWKVDDEATAELMKRFYAGMFTQGLTPAAALRQAQLEMWQSRRWHEPYYWAAFVIQGQYDQKEVVPSKFPLLRIIVSASLFLLGLACVFLLIKRRHHRVSSGTMPR